MALGRGHERARLGRATQVARLMAIA